jgi:hypothetical protein
VSLRRLAEALDVSRAELRDAFREVRSNLDDDFGERQAALVTFLAERFNLPEEKVEEALPDFPGPPPGFGPGGP